MGHVRMGVPTDLVLDLVAAHPIHSFVETGTFRGGTAFWAAKHFKKVYTIEINPEISRATSQSPHSSPNIEFIIGNSADQLEKVVGKLDGPAIFWLDGHYCGPGTGAEQEECPIMEELAALRKADQPVILIDDARCFLGPPPPPHKPEEWVNIDTIFRYLFDHFPHHTTTIHDDVIIALPRQMKPILDANWQKHYTARFFGSDVPPPSFPRRVFRRLRSFLAGA